MSAVSECMVASVHVCENKRPPHNRDPNPDSNPTPTHKRSPTVHGDEIGGLGRKAALEKRPPSLMVVND